MRKYLLMMVLPIITMTAAAQKTQTVDTLQVTTTPQTHCANCEKKVKSNIRFVKCVNKIETSVPQQTVTIIYDPRESSFQDFEKAFEKIGFRIEAVGKEK